MAGRCAPVVGVTGVAGRLGAVPAELRAEPRWVCWRRVERGGRTTKMPVCAATGGMASSTDAATWAAFEDACAAVARWRCDGVGFVFGPDRAFTGLDLDHVLVGGVLAEKYRWVVEEAGTYCEVSPSGDGLHLIFRGGKPEGASRCRKGQPEGRVVEMYDRDRFFTVTGAVFEGRGELRANPEVVRRAYERWIEPPAAVAGQGSLDGAPVGGAGGGGGRAAVDDDDNEMTDEELLERAYASRSGGQIRALMRGDTSAQGGDHSAADMALCSHLAFWLGGDAGRVDRVFRTSGLMRDKWDSRRGGTTYGAQTVERAVAGCSEAYRPRRRKDKNVCSTASRRAAARGVSQERAEEVAPSGEPDFSQPPSCGSWAADSKGRLWVVDAEGEPRYSVTSTAPWIAADLVDVDTGDVRALVRVAVPGGVRERALDRDVLLNQSRVIGALAPLGANVTSTNAKDVVRYLTDCEKHQGWARPRSRSVTHLGWADGPLGSFMPYDAGSGGVRFDVADVAILNWTVG